MNTPRLTVAILLACAGSVAGQNFERFGTIRYPAAGNIQLDEGTVELYVVAGFDSKAEYENRTHGTSLGVPFMLSSNDRNKLYLTFIQWSCSLVQTATFDTGYHSYVGSVAKNTKERDFWLPGKHHVIAFTWRDNIRQIFIDGQHRITKEVEGDFRHLNLSDMQIDLGAGHSYFTIDEVRISSVMRTPQELDAAAKHAPVADVFTLLLDRCDGEPLEVISDDDNHRTSQRIGQYQIVDGKYGKAMKLWTGPPLDGIRRP